MATFTVDDEDLAGLVRRDCRLTLRQQGPWPAGAFGAAAILLASSNAGRDRTRHGLAWSWSLVATFHGIRPRYPSHHGAMGGPVTAAFTDEGLRTAVAMGEGHDKLGPPAALRGVFGGPTQGAT